MTTNTDNLVPEAAVKEATEALTNRQAVADTALPLPAGVYACAALQAAAPLIIAAELERLASTMPVNIPSQVWGPNELRARAAELREGPVTDPRDALAEDIFMALIGSPTGSYYEDETEIRSAPYSPTVDVKLGDQWYRVSASPIEEPISVEEHRNGVVERS